MSAGIQQAFHEYAENRIPDRPEPTIRYTQNFIFLVIQEGVVMERSRSPTNACCDAGVGILGHLLYLGGMKAWQ